MQCTACLELHRSHNRSYRAKLKTQGICADCGQPSESYRCKLCAENSRTKARTLRQWREANHNYNADHMRRLREQRVEAGLCSECGTEERRPGLTMGQRCADLYNERKRTAAARNQVAA
jgi:hypothetical protein